MKLNTELDTEYARFRLLGDADGFQGSLFSERRDDGILYVTIRIRASRKARPPVYRLTWSHPSTGIHALWRPSCGEDHSFEADWGKGFPSESTFQAPVLCLKNIGDQNRLTFAFSDASNPITINAGLHEEDSTFSCSVVLFEKDAVPIDCYKATLRVDTREIPYYEALRDVSSWWMEAGEMRPLHVPEEAFLPMYSTWYSFHQQFTSEELERQCALAKTYGCSTVIVDDGWQTSDHSRGYAYTGDWEVTEDKIPDIKRHVAAVHMLGMKYMLWFAVPFIGEHSKAWQQFRGKFFAVNGQMHAGVLDPRFPEVRQYLVKVYEKAVCDWGIDGLKLDFVDSMRPRGDTPMEMGAGRDFDSLPAAVDALFSEMIRRLTVVRPELLIEFRQSYIGPQMRNYANMFRAADCPNDMVQNRVSTLDLRLLSGSTAVHSDMILFHPGESPENAALQLLNVLFAVPQISVRLDTLTDDQARMLRFWLSFFIEERTILQSGTLAPFHPELCYPGVEASVSGKRLLAAYSDLVLPLHMGESAEEILLVNGFQGEAVTVDADGASDLYDLCVKNCFGEEVFRGQYRFTRGLHRITVPQAGLADFKLALP